MQTSEANIHVCPIETVPKSKFTSLSPSYLTDCLKYPETILTSIINTPFVSAINISRVYKFICYVELFISNFQNCTE